jgi:hypothetical protein
MTESALYLGDLSNDEGSHDARGGAGLDCEVGDAGAQAPGALWVVPHHWSVVRGD